MTDQNKQGRERYIERHLPENATAEYWLEFLGDKIQPHYEFKSQTGSSSGGGGAWKRCSEHGCLGEALPKGTCLVHSDSATKHEHLTKIAQTKNTLSLNGLVITQKLWNEIAASPVFNDSVPIVPISFVAAEISASIIIEDRILHHSLDFTGAKVFEGIRLNKCTFNQPPILRFCFFNSGPFSCKDSTFNQDVDISFSGNKKCSTSFGNCTFRGRCVAEGVAGGLHLIKSTFEQNVSFKYAMANFILNEARFLGSMDFSDADCALRGESLFAKNANRLGTFKAKSFVLPRATFQSRIHVDVVSGYFDLSDATLNEGGIIDVQSDSVQLGGLSIGGPLRVSGKKQNTSLTEIHSLLNSDVGQISFAGVDLTRCSFYGTHDIGNIDILSTVKFPKSPWWAGRRRYIADEYAWRFCAGRIHSYGWHIQGVHVGDELPRVRGEPQKILLPVVDAAQVAAIYRELRRSLEAKSDMSGAADFYYGEMEMRRWSAPLLERGLLWLYWLISGYGMRAHRALLSWFSLIGLGAYLMTFGGFTSCPYTIPRALLFATRATLPGVRTLENLTQAGEMVEIGLRIFGPLTIALFLISIRGKLMRKPST